MTNFLAAIGGITVGVVAAIVCLLIGGLIGRQLRRHGPRRIRGAQWWLALSREPAAHATRIFHARRRGLYVITVPEEER